MVRALEKERSDDTDTVPAEETASMSTAALEDEYDEFDELGEEDDDDDQGLSGLVVLLMGVVMIGAVASVAFIAFQHGVKIGETRAEAPYVTADPSPVKIANDTVDAAGDRFERQAFDRFDGASSEPVEVIAAGPEEPVARNVDNPIETIVSESMAQGGPVEDDAVADRIAALADADTALGDVQPVQPTNEPVEPEGAADRSAVAPTPEPQGRAAVPATPASAAAASDLAANTRPLGVAVQVANALSGTHLVQIGAFGSQEEAAANWTRLERELGDYVKGKSNHVLPPADAADKYYRLRIGPFASADEARTYCAGLKERGRDCLIRAN